MICQTLQDTLLFPIQLLRSTQNTYHTAIYWGLETDDSGSVRSKLEHKPLSLNMSFHSINIILHKFLLLHLFISIQNIGPSNRECSYGRVS